MLRAARDILPEDFGYFLDRGHPQIIPVNKVVLEFFHCGLRLRLGDIFAYDGEDEGVNRLIELDSGRAWRVFASVSDIVFEFFLSILYCLS